MTPYDLFAHAMAWGLAAAIAIGIAVGWGGHTYVAEHIEGWAGSAQSATPAPREHPQTDGGRDTDN